jgi:hypothetical protein
MLDRDTLHGLAAEEAELDAAKRRFGEERPDLGRKQGRVANAYTAAVSLDQLEAIVGAIAAL